jgi:tetratricopeptide (TPR) repeat protein
MNILTSRLKLRDLTSSQPLTLAFLTVLAIILFLAVTALSGMYNAQQAGLADRWSARGMADLKANRFPPAVNDFRTALLYARGDAGYQLHLAQALMGEQKYDEAEAYLTSLWERDPDNGEVNLELARIAASRKESERAIRYYHNAIYATWPASREQERQRARFELIDLLLRNRAYAQAQSELIALAANLGDDPAQRAHAGDLFLTAEDSDHALAEFRMSLRGDEHNQDALAGAGRAAFELAHYAEAARYLREAVAAAPNDAASASLLRVTERVLQMDPYRQGINATERDRIVTEDFAAAGARLDACNGAASASPLMPWQSLKQSWTNLKPRITPGGLRQDPDQVQAAMSLVFNIEHETAGACGLPSETDTALQLIANLREGS